MSEVLCIHRDTWSKTSLILTFFYVIVCVSNGEKTHWTIASAAWLCRWDLPISRVQDRFYSLNCCLLGRVWLSRDHSTKLDVYLIFNRLGNDRWHIKRKIEWRLSLPPCTSSPGMGRLLQGIACASAIARVMPHHVHIISYSGEESNATRGRYYYVLSRVRSSDIGCTSWILGVTKCSTEWCCCIYGCSSGQVSLAPANFHEMNIQTQGS